VDEVGMIAEAYGDGYWAALDGCPREENPYAAGTANSPEARQSWDEGWEDAQAVFYVSER
jgi:ribosome modulation factor